MEHEVFVPVPVASLRRTLGDPVRVARCVPGFQQDADAASGPLTGRLKVRVGGHTITYRGVLTLRPGGTEDRFSVTGEGVEARGTGSAELSLTIGLTEAGGGTSIQFAGTAGGDGRIVDAEEDAALAAAHRLLDRLTQQLVTESLATRGEDDEVGDAAEPAGRSASGADGSPPAGEAGPPCEDLPAKEPPAGGTPAEEPRSEEPLADRPHSGETPPDEKVPGAEPLFDTPVPPPPLDPSAELEFTVPDGPPAEAAHARRTMIGRSTEEVDHAPPRGRYAPVPSPDTSTAGVALRWAAPAAALVIASAVVVGRALRRRR
ncbi:SRPBCC domain-containing protein [Streptomyces sp. NPDC005899]|uniref:SRPBCC domain-containing protein n=1 Tax=Streptomyces sp. NPDC005899 TaxID=3155716 RepID=UPI0033F91C8A